MIFPLLFLSSMRLFTESASLILPKRTRILADKLKFLTVFMLLSCLLIDPMVGTFTWIHYKKSLVKREVQKQINQGIDENKLVVLKFSKQETQTELRWSHPREFEYKQKMYDIVETKTVGDTVYYKCWYDHEETMLNRQLEEAAEQIFEKSPKISNEIAILMSSSYTLYCPFSLYEDISIPKFLCHQVDLFYDLYSQILAKPPTPPPQLS